MIVKAIFKGKLFPWQLNGFQCSICLFLNHNFADHSIWQLVLQNGCLVFHHNTVESMEGKL